MLEADAMHAAIRATHHEIAAGACSPGQGEWCGGMRLAVTAKLVTVGTVNTSGANFSPVVMLKGKLRLSYCAWCGADLDIERRLNRAMDTLQLYDAVENFILDVRTNPRNERILSILGGPNPTNCHVVVRDDCFLRLERAVKDADAE